MKRDSWNDTANILPEEGREVLVARGGEGEHIIAHIQYDGSTPHWKQANDDTWTGNINEWNRWLAVLVG